jgi:hypothetical protein
VWKPGDCVALRGIYRERVWSAQPGIVVKDSPEEVALAISPGVECMVPRGYSKGKKGDWRRWDYKKEKWDLESFIWHTNRFLVLLEPQKYYATFYIWKADTGEFQCYYINFQLPFRRSHCGFDTLDLELDIVIDPECQWRWKDEEDYQKGIDCGIILKEWTEEIESAKKEIFEKLAKRKYPLDNAWLDWKPDCTWPLPRLPVDWEKV